MNMRTELLECLVRQCVVEVLDQIEEEASASKLKSSGIGKDDNKKPSKQKIPIQFTKGKKQNVNIKKLDESENPELGGDKVPPTGGHDTGDKPAVAKDGPKPTEPKPEKPKPEEQPSQRIPKGAVLLNPKDKSKLQPIKLQGRDDSAIERTLHQVAVSIAGSRTKVSLSAKRLAREIISNPSSTIFFFFGKTDPESDEVFLMADKSLQVAKDTSIQPEELGGSPQLTRPSSTLNYTNMTDQDYETYMNRRNLPSPRYGVDDPDDTGNPANIGENATKLIKKMVNQILNS